MPLVAEFEQASGGATITASQVTVYSLCALKYRFTYVDRLPRPWKSSAFAFGTAIHSALEAWQMSRLAGEEMKADEVERTFLADWEAEKAGGVRFKDDDQDGTLVQRGKALLALAMDYLKKDQPQAVELPFVADVMDPETGEVMDFKIRGVFDLLLSDDRVVEMKTAARRWDEDAVQRNLQLTTYSYAYERVTGRSPKLEVLTLLKTKVPRLEALEATRSKEDKAWFVHLVERVRAGIKNNVFFPNPGWPCAECEYAEPCKAWRG